MNHKIVDVEGLSSILAQWQVQSHSVVFTNGCFDILHIGHVHTLSEAKQLGDKLVVGINSDDSVRRLKGLERPINGENERAQIIAALGVVDLVVLFGEDTPINLIEQIKPRHLVKGGDWKTDQIVGGNFVVANGGAVHSIPFLEGYSTSSLIEKIQKL